MFFNLPTLLTWARIVAIPLIIGVFYLEGMNMAQKNLIATVMFVVFAATDWADGYLARKMNVVSVLGKFLDPLADKLLVMASLIYMVPMGRIPSPRSIFLIRASFLASTTASDAPRRVPRPNGCRRVLR